MILTLFCVVPHLYAANINGKSNMAPSGLLPPQNKCTRLPTDALPTIMSELK